MTDATLRTETARAVEALVNETADAGQNPVELALLMLAVGADLLTRAWDAERTLSTFDLLVDIAARGHAGATAH